MFLAELIKPSASEFSRSGKCWRRTHSRFFSSSPESRKSSNKYGLALSQALVASLRMKAASRSSIMLKRVSRPTSAGLSRTISCANPCNVRMRYPRCGSKPRACTKPLMRAEKLSTAELTRVTTKTSWSAPSLPSAISWAANAESIYVLPEPGTAAMPSLPPLYSRMAF